MTTVGDLIYSGQFDVNCEWKVYDCTDENITWDDAEVLWSSADMHKPLDSILDMNIGYITIYDSVLRIEATK